MALTVTLFINAAVVIVGAYNVAKISNDPERVAAVIAKPLQYAPELLRDVLGPAAKNLFAAALLASGQSSTVTGTYAVRRQHTK